MVAKVEDFFKSYKVRDGKDARTLCMYSNDAAGRNTND